MTRAIGDRPGHPFNEFRRGAGPSRPALPGSASVGVHAGGRQGEEDATLRGSPADVRSGDPSEARPLRAVGTARSGMPRPDGLNMTHTISGGALFNMVEAEFKMRRRLMVAPCMLGWLLVSLSLSLTLSWAAEGDRATHESDHAEDVI